MYRWMIVFICLLGMPTLHAQMQQETRQVLR